jgi:hypothetical protein
MTYSRSGRPTNAQRAARAKLDGWYEHRAAALEVVGQKAKDLGEYLAFVSGRDRMDLNDVELAIAATNAETMAILRRPLSSF